MGRFTRPTCFHGKAFITLRILLNQSAARRSHYQDGGLYARAINTGFTP